MKINEDLVAIVKAAVEEALKVRDGEERTATIEASLGQANTMVTNLTDTISTSEAELAAATEENTDLKTQLADLLVKAEELNTKLETTDQEKEALETRVNTAEGQLLEIARESVLKQRMCLLEEAKVAMAGERLDAQMAVVKVQSDEEFASYMEDRVELRSSIEETFKAKAEEEKKVEEVSEEGEIEVAPANVDEALMENASLVPVVEEQEKETIETRFARMGKSMAASVKIGRK